MCKADPRKLNDLKLVYEETLGKPLIISDCSGCISDAITELSIVLDKINNPQKYKKMSEQQSKYKLKPNTIIDLTYSTGEYVTNSNVTDEKMIELIKKNPAYLNFLEEYPEDEVEELLKKPEEKKIKEKKAAPKDEKKEAPKTDSKTEKKSEPGDVRVVKK